MSIIGRLILLLFYISCSSSLSESCATLTGIFNNYLFENNLTQYQITKLSNKFRFDECLCEKTCLRKCCASGYSFSEVRKKCVLDKDNDHHIRIYEEWLNLSDNFDYVPGIECSDIYYQDPITNPKDVFLILKNGLMHIIPPNVFINASAYCLDYFENKGICAIVCFPSDNENVLTTQFKPLGKI